MAIEVNSQTASPDPSLGAGVKKAFFLADYPQRSRLMNFLEVSYQGGIKYKKGKDSDGHNILIEHEQEFPDITGEQAVENLFSTQARTEANILQSRYYRRVRLAAYENHVKPIVDKFSAYLLRNAPKRDESKVAGAIASIELDERIREMVDEGLKLSEYWIGVDAVNLGDATGSKLTVAQLSEIDPERKGQPYIVLFDPRRIVDFDLASSDGECTRVVVMEMETTKATFTEPAKAKLYFKEWTADAWVRYEAVTKDGGELKLDANSPNIAGTVYVREESRGPHSFKRCPIRRFSPPFPIEDVCELNRAIFNASSLLDEELWNSTFTMRAFFGIRPEDMRKVVKGAGRFLTFENSNAKQEPLGGLVEQSRAIQERIDALKRSLYEIVSMDSSQSKNVAEAAEKKKRDMEALYTCLVKIVGHIEDAENWLLVMLGLIDPTKPDQRTTYGRAFDVSSLSELMDDLAKMAELPFAPADMKRSLVTQILQKVDPAGDHAEYLKLIEESIDLTPAVVDGIVALKNAGFMTPEVAAFMLGVPENQRKAFIEAAAGHEDPQGPGVTDGQAPQDGEDPEEQAAGSGSDGGVAGGGAGGDPGAGGPADGPGLD